MIVPGQEMQTNMTETCTTLYLKEWPLLDWNLNTEINMSRSHLLRVILVWIRLFQIQK